MHDESQFLADDVRTLHRMGYAQELARRLSGFSNYALSMTIIGIQAGGLTSFHVAYSAAGGGAVGLGWPLMAGLSLVVAATLGQISSAFPTAGGLYHWAAILGGRGWGWATACFNLAGLVTVLAAVNVGTVRFAASAFDPDLDVESPAWLQLQFLFVAAITASQAFLNHLGVRVVQVLTTFSGWWILLITAALTIALFLCASTFEPSRLATFTNYTGLGKVWPRTEWIGWAFALGLLLPAFTITGFDASAHAAEETLHAAANVPRGMVRAVLVSGVAGWFMVAAIVLAIPDPDEAAAIGEGVVQNTLFATVPRPLAISLVVGIFIAQYLCGLATVTSASRSAFAFARDGGLPLSKWVRRVSYRFRTPAIAIWGVAAISVGFAAYTPVYTTITAVCVIFLFVSYAVPAGIAFLAYGRWWKEFGPWTLGRWFRPLAALSVLTSVGLIVIGVQPPNDRAAEVLLVFSAALAIGWFARARYTFPGPPHGTMTAGQRAAIQAAEAAVHETVATPLDNGKPI